MTSNNVTDAAVIADLLHQLPEDEVLESLRGDGAYDTQPIYEAVMRRGAIPVIPLRKNARIRKGAAFLCIAMRLLPHAGVWEGIYGNAGAVSPQKFGGNQTSASNDWANE